MSAMDCGVANMPHNACYSARIQTNFKNQASNSSLSHDVMPNSEPLPSPRRWSPTYQPRRRSRQFPTSLSFVPTTSITGPDGHEPTASLPRRPADRSQVPISPFRSVRRMKEPFQLVLPSSPKASDGLPPAKPMRLSKPPGSHTLRTWRSDQNLKRGGLMPSPPISESRPASVGGSYIDYKNDLRKEKMIATLSPTKEYGEQIENVMIHYEGSYPTHWPHRAPKSDIINNHTPESSPIWQYEHKISHSPHLSHIRQPASISSATSVSSPKPRLSANSPKLQRPRTATVSSEASWIPSNLAYCETWLQNVPYDPQDNKEQQPQFTNRRKVQIVEQDPPTPMRDDLPTRMALESPVVLQRFAVASRPKLVNIARQSSPNLPNPVSPRPHPSHPRTPAQHQEEVSAFSPDTPMNIPDQEPEQLKSAFSFSSYEDGNDDDDDAYTDPGSLTSDSVTSTVIYEMPESAQGERAPSPQPEIRSGSVSPKASSQPLSPGRRSTSPEKHEEDKQRTWDREWTLDELSHSVNDFPRHMLRLTSPVIVFIRGCDEQVLLRHFRTIFPEVADNLLDCLCAALVARNYLISLSSLHRHKPSLPPRSDIYAVDSVPTKAYSTLGIQLPTGAPGRIKDRVFTSRSTDLRRDIERIVDNLIFAICGRSDDTIKAAVEVLVQVLESTAAKS